jgi:hypothetical protein
MIRQFGKFLNTNFEGIDFVGFCALVAKIFLIATKLPSHKISQKI